MPTNTMASSGDEESSELRRGPWTSDEDSKLSRYIATNGEGRWNLLAKCSGLKRTGKSCRLRWLNYLKPDVKRGNLTPQEQLLILQLHSKWGNRWSKIAAHLPGRTDNEIKNYWRTRVQKQARHLKINSDSKKFLEALQHFWMPRLLEKIEQNSSQLSSLSSTSTRGTQTSVTSSVITESIPIASSPANQINEVKGSYKVDNESSFSIYSTNPITILEQNKNSDHKNHLVNDCYHVDIANFDVEGLNVFDMCDIESREISDCQFPEIDWTKDDAAATLWEMDESWDLPEVIDFALI